MPEALELPKIIDIKCFTKNIKKFPLSTKEIISQAEQNSCDKRMINFMKLFPERLVFKNRGDFLNCATLMANLLYEEKNFQAEFLIGSVIEEE